MATAKKLPSGNWRVRVFAGKDTDGKNQYKSFTESTERKANLAAMDWQEHYREVNSDSSNMTVKEAIDAHIKSMSNILSPSTIFGYKRIQAGHFKNIIDRSLSSLTNKIINEEVNKEAGKYSPKTLYNSFGLLKTVLAKYRPDFKYDIKLPEVYLTITEIPQEDDLVKICSEAYGTEMEIPILLAFWLGLRVSEIRGLKMSKIYSDKIVIDNAIVRGENGPVEKKTKTKSSTRVLELPKYIKKRIDTLITDGREYITSLSGQVIYKRFVKICKAAGVGPFRFHDLRHTNASMKLDENIPDKYISEDGGWKSDIYKKRYEHTNISKRQSVNAQMDKKFESIVNKIV